MGQSHPAYGPEEPDARILSIKGVGKLCKRSHHPVSLKYWLRLTVNGQMYNTKSTESQLEMEGLGEMKKRIKVVCCYREGVDSHVMDK